MTITNPGAFFRAAAMHNIIAFHLPDQADACARRIANRTVAPPTPEQVAQHARAEALLRELEDNPFYDSGYEGVSVNELRDVVHTEYAETVEEWIARMEPVLERLVDAGEITKEMPL